MLIDWINDVLVGERIIVKDLAEDLYDGQVLQKLFGETLNDPWPVTGLCESMLGMWRAGVGTRIEQLVRVDHRLSGKPALTYWGGA